MHEANPALAFALAVENFSAPQQIAAHFDVIAQRRQRHRRQTHHVASGEPGADSEHRAPGRHLVDGGD